MTVAAVVVPTLIADPGLLGFVGDAGRQRPGLRLSVGRRGGRTAPISSSP
jgi:hypothetical protein